MAYLTEILQYVHIVELLHLQYNQFACMMIGTRFSWVDLLMQTPGIGVVWLGEWLFS